MAEIPTRFVSLCHMFGVLIIAFGVESNKTSLTSILVPLGMGIMIPVSSSRQLFMAILFVTCKFLDGGVCLSLFQTEKMEKAKSNI